MDELEVVQVSPSEALNRALRKEKKKTRRTRAEARPMTVTTSTEVLESQGQELLWIEENTKSSSHVNPTISRKKVFKLLGTLRGSKHHSQETNRNEMNPRIVLLNSPMNPKASLTNENLNSTNYLIAAEKAQEARDLLDQALFANHDTNHDMQSRSIMLHKAFSNAVEANQLLDPDIGDSPELQHCKSLGEQEAMEASRIITSVNAAKSSLAASSSTGLRRPLEPSSLLDSQENHKANKDVSHNQIDDADHEMQSSSSVLLTTDVLKVAYEHAEAARRYLESMLPENLLLQTQANSVVNKENQVLPFNLMCNPHPENPILDGTLSPPFGQVEIDEEAKRNVAEKHAIIARMQVQQSNTMSTLGFDNTFQNEDTFTINSLNAFLDGPMSGTGENSPANTNITTPENKIGSNIVQPERNNHELAPITVLPIDNDDAATTNVKRDIKFSFFRRKNSGNKVTSGSSSASGVVPSYKGERSDRFFATIAPISDDDLELPDPQELQKLAQVNDVERLTRDRLQAAAAASVTMPDMDPVRIPSNDPMRKQPLFVQAPHLAPGILTRKSWEDLADGASLADVASLPDETNVEKANLPPRSLSFVESKRFRLFRSKKTKSRPHPVPVATSLEKDPVSSSSADAQQGIEHGEMVTVSADDTQVSDGIVNSISVITDDSGIPDDHCRPSETQYNKINKSTAQQESAAQEKLHSDYELMPSNPTVLRETGVRTVSSWWAINHGETLSTVQSNYVEVDCEDETKLILANKEEAMNVIEASTQARPIIGAQSMTCASNLDQTTSFSDQIEQGKELTLEQTGLASQATPSPAKKKSLYKRWKSRPAQF